MAEACVLDGRNPSGITHRSSSILGETGFAVVPQNIPLSKDRDITNANVTKTLVLAKGSCPFTILPPLWHDGNGRDDPPHEVTSSI
jgi:hypothetical protein